jgi:exosortase
MVNLPPLRAPASGLASLRRDWVIVGAALALGLSAFGLVFREEIADAIYAWNNSYAYGYCYLILPVAAYLAVDRREAVAATSPRPEPWVASLAIPTAAAWFVAYWLGIMAARQLMVMTLFQIMAAALLGLRSYRALAAPFLYLYFLVPLGYFLVPLLQNLVVHFTTAGLDLLGVPVFSSGTVIEIPEGTFGVEQECAGLRSLLAMAAFVVPVACLIYTSPLRRALFIGLSLAVAIAANSLRVLGTLLLAHVTANPQAIEDNHVLGGWVFYVVVGAVLVAIGCVFRQERNPVARLDRQSRRPTTGASIVALAAVLLIATAPRVAADYLDEFWSDTGAVAARIVPPALRGCATPAVPPVSTGRTTERGSAFTNDYSAAYSCNRDLFVLTLRRYPSRVSASALFSSLREAQTPPDADVIDQSDFRAGSEPDSPVWQVTQSQQDGRYVTVATALWLHGRPAGFGIAARVDQALNALRRAPIPPVLVVVTHSSGDNLEGARRAVAHFLDKTELRRLAVPRPGS